MSGTRPKLGDVLLCVDQGIMSGHATIRVGDSKPHSSGLARNALEREEALVHLLASASGMKCGAWLVLEDHSTMPLSRGTRLDKTTCKKGASGLRSTASVLGMGDARGRWREQAELKRLPKCHVLSVEPKTWKRAVLGGRWAYAGTEAVRDESVKWATALLGYEPIHDTAAAVAMAVYCSREWALGEKAATR